MSRHNNCYTNKNNDPSRNSKKVYCAWDTETDGLGGELLCISYCYPFQNQSGYNSGVIVKKSKEDMILDFLDIVDKVKFYKKQVIWLAHNMQYDLRQLVPYFIDKKYKIICHMRNETSIFKIEIRNIETKTKIIFQDSFALFPMSLKKFTESFSSNCAKLDVIDFSKEKFNVKNKTHLEYAKRDSESLLYAFEKFVDSIEKNFNCQVNTTISSTAMKAFEETLKDDECYFYSKNNSIEQFIRESYRGGLVFLTTTEKQDNCVTYDINSSFPASMKLGVPYGKYRYCKKRKKDLPGFIKVKVKSPDNLIVPILGYKKDGTNYYPSGTFETIVTTIELDFALKNGYTLIEDLGGVYFEKLVYPFQTFVNKCETLRKKYKGTSEELIVKLIQNSVYGKFGSNREVTDFLIEPPDDQKIGRIPLDEDEIFWIGKSIDDDLPCLPQFASWISANSRINLLKNVYEIGPEKCFYADTDSITLKIDKNDEAKIDCGDLYGQFKREKEWKTFRPIAPKVYAGQKMTGEWTGACKGVPKKVLKEEDWKDLYETKSLEKSFVTLPSLRVALTKKTTNDEAKTTTRKSTAIENSNSFIEENGKIRPKKIEEI